MRKYEEYADYEGYAKEFGTVMFERREYALIQDAYLNGTFEDSYYSAQAIDRDGKRYGVRWEIKEDYKAEDGDESNACDWDNPSEVWAE